MSTTQKTGATSTRKGGKISNKRGEVSKRKQDKTKAAAAKTTPAGNVTKPRREKIDIRTADGKFGAGNVANPGGRPTAYTDAVGDEICERIANGESLRKICYDAHMPAKPTVLAWGIDRSHPFSDRYTRAREMQAWTMVDEIIEIADDSASDITANENGSEIVDHEHITRARLRVDTRKWFASKLLPKQFGEKVSTELSGPNGGPIAFTSVEELTDEQLAAIASGRGARTAS